MVVKLIEHPTEQDWMEVKRRALVTVGKTPIKVPDEGWMRKILAARHSPIRRLRFSFYIECPSWVAVHYCRHVHAQPYVQSQRNDRQDKFDRNKAPQDTPVKMILDMNAEELINIMNKRLCETAAAETRVLAEMMRTVVVSNNPEFRFELVPNCARCGGICHEMYPCGHPKKVSDYA